MSELSIRDLSHINHAALTHRRLPRLKDSKEQAAGRADPTIPILKG
jgi:hypothetical protein